MEITRRDWDQLTQRVGRMESKIYQLESMLKNIESAIKPENLVRRIKQAEEDAKLAAEKADIFRKTI